MTQTEVVETPTPDPEVTVESVNTYTAPAEEAQPAPTQAVAPRPTLAVATNRGLGSAITGYYDRNDFRFPQLKLVQGSGPLSKEYNDGTILLANSELLPPPSLKENAQNPSIFFVPVSMHMYFRQKLSDEEVKSGLMPLQVDTVEEVEAAGGTIIWPRGQDCPPNYWGKAARILLILEQPEGTEHPSFISEFDGRLYAPAVYYAAGGGWTNFGSPLFNAAAQVLYAPVLDAKGQPQRDPNGRIIKEPMFHKNIWSLNFVKKARPGAQYTPWTPQIRQLAEESGPELRAYVTTLLSNPNLTDSVESE